MIRLFNTDNMNFMRSVPDKFYELAIIDLEYNIGASKPSIKPNTAVQKNGSSLRIKQPNYKPKEWDFKLSSDEYLNELFRISQNQIIWGGNYYGLSGGYIVWDKLNGESDQFDCELAFCSFNKRTDIVYFLWAGMFQGVYCGKDIRKALIQQGNKQLNEERIHVTQKPVALYKWLLKNYAKEGDKVFDSHFGSGSHGIACIDMGFSLDACELDKDYFEASVNRIQNHAKQLDAFRQQPEIKVIRNLDTHVE